MITVKQQPPAYHSLNHPVYYLFQSDNVAQPNFKFVFDVYVNFVKVSTVKLYPEPGTNLCLFDPSKILRSYVSPNNFIADEVQLQSPAVEGYHRLTYGVNVGEEYGEPAVTYLNLWSSGSVKAYNYYNTFLPRVSSQSQLDGYVTKAMTDRPTSERVTMNDIGFFPVFNPAGLSGPIMQIEVRAYDASGTQIGFRLLQSFAELIQVGYTPVCLNSLGAFITSSVAYYTIKVGGVIYTYTIDSFCKWQNYDIHFLNQWGGFESAFFRMKSTRTMDVERKTFGSRTVAVNSTTNTYNPWEPAWGKAYLPSERVYSTKQTHKMKLTTDFLSDQEYTWLGQLIASPVVYLRLFDAVSYMVPVKITGTNYEYKNRQANGLTPLEIEVEILLNHNSQGV